MMRKSHRLLTIAMVVTIPLIGLARTARAEPPANASFASTWERTDLPVSDGQAIRTWMWGPEAFTGELIEDYQESPGGARTVQYFDKSRMEITDPIADPNDIWYVTNGLLVVELITGQLQTGDNSFAERQPAAINVAGDPDDPNAPTYATFAQVLDQGPHASGETVAQRISHSGTLTYDAALAGQDVTIATVDDVTNHAIATPFWDFMNSSGAIYQDGAFTEGALFDNPYFATGRPITEPAWANVLVGGEPMLVLIQCFERRCLTYTPGNASEWQVEAGNVGRHYYAWRYGNGQ